MIIKGEIGKQRSFIFIGIKEVKYSIPMNNCRLYGKMAERL